MQIQSRAGTLMLQVKTTSIAALQKMVEAAQKECKSQ
jgi:hypothetical protein